MFVKKKCFWLICVFYLVLDALAETDDLKSSLVFVIDDTGSMSDDIRGVRQCAFDIFDVVTNSNNSHIEDFILVTFNDPEGDPRIMPTKHRITTKDKYAFKKALGDIDVDGGGGCPELAMTGIEHALELSQTGSLLYVFTDASPKDYEKQRKVISMAQGKSIKVVFVLTGKCRDGKEVTYNNVATATGGIVFNLNSRIDVPYVIEHVKTQIKNRQSTVAIKDFSAGTNNFKFEVDSAMKELVFTVSGDNPSLKVTDPAGKIAPTTVAAKRDTFVIAKITEVKPGTYTAEVKSTSRNSIVVTAETSVHFRHGFSTWEPGSIGETVTRPIPGEKSYLSVKLDIEGKSNVVLDAVEILTLDDKVVVEKPLKLVDTSKLYSTLFYSTNGPFYTSVETITPPDHLFRVAIRGHDTETNEIITRISLTPIEPQSVVIDTTENKKPIITVIGKDKINAEYDEELLLKCKVNAYPKPRVTWQDSAGITLNSTLSIIEHPDGYLSTLTIDKVNENNTYYCVARNDYGGDSKKIQVETVRKIYFNVIKTPKGSTTEYGKEAVFECEVHANPPAEITWFKNGVEVKEDDNVKISSNKLTIKRVDLKNSGQHLCKAKNENTKRHFFFNIQVTGVSKPKINKTIEEIHAKFGSNIEIACNVIGGQPKPNIVWYLETSDGKPQEIKEAYNKEKWIMQDTSYHSTDSLTVYCEARNDLGFDYHRTVVIFEYPPNILGVESELKIAKVGDRVNLACDVTGEPKPSVQWLLNDKQLALTARYSLDYESYGINFFVTREDAGTYVCQATNAHGTATKTVELRTNKSPSIDVPSKTNFEKMVGEDLNLPCRADGSPEPRLEWIFYSLDPRDKPRHLGSRNELSLRRLQLSDEGFYNCIASNEAGSFSITYGVKVLAPPNIENIYPDKTFFAVIEDTVLKVPCKATGSPIPTITWIKDGVNVATGTEWYDVDAHGTLLIKNVDKQSAGDYVCEARNRIGVDTESYEVIVEAYPKPGPPSRTVKVQQGKTKILQCNIPHKRTDYFRWFKDGREIALTKDFIFNSETSEAGLYTCRVSNFDKSTSETIKVIITIPGEAPTFITNEEELIQFEEGVMAFMDCTAKGSPQLEVTWWHNGKQLPVKDMAYDFDMKVSDKGKYYCLVKNAYGTITRKFEIFSIECLLNIETELKGNQPLLLSSSNTWPELEVIDGTIKINPSESLIISCPSGIKNLHKKEAHAYCQRDLFNIEGNNYKLSDLQCEEQVMPVAKNTRTRCVSNNPQSRNIKIGYYDANGRFLEVYEICFDIEKRVPIFAKHAMQYTLANVEPNERNWHKNGLVRYNDDEIFDCRLQTNSISAVIGSWFHRDDQCCFSKRLLVNPKDVSPGLPQTATYNALNAVPHWSSCNSENWQSIESRVRRLARSTNTKLSVWTGTLGQLEINGQNISIYDKSSNGQNVPKYLFKVVKDSTTDAALAIIQLNIPDVTSLAASRHLLCSDICQEVGWMRSRSWRDVTKGYTFCCNAAEFERVSGYRGVFGSAGKVLYDVDLVTTHSLT